jgi:hypothetical protein
MNMNTLLPESAIGKLLYVVWDLRKKNKITQKGRAALKGKNNK